MGPTTPWLGCSSDKIPRQSTFFSAKKMPSVHVGVYIYTCVYHTLLGGGFPSSIITRQPSGCQYRTIRTSSESCRRRTFQRNVFSTDAVPTVHISTMEIRPGGCDKHRRIRYLSPCRLPKNCIPACLVLMLYVNT